MGTKKLLFFRLQQNFFGLNSEYQQVVYEELFSLKYHGNFSLFESYNLPVSLRRWFIQRLIKQKTEEANEIENSKTNNC